MTSWSLMANTVVVVEFGTDGTGTSTAAQAGTAERAPKRATAKTRIHKPFPQSEITKAQLPRGSKMRQRRRASQAREYTSGNSPAIGSGERGRPPNGTCPQVSARDTIP